MALLCVVSYNIDGMAGYETTASLYRTKLLKEIERLASCNDVICLQAVGTDRTPVVRVFIVHCGFRENALTHYGLKIYYKANKVKLEASCMPSVFGDDRTSTELTRFESSRKFLVMS